MRYLRTLRACALCLMPAVLLALALSASLWVLVVVFDGKAAEIAPALTAPWSDPAASRCCSTSQDARARLSCCAETRCASSVAVRAR
jgi:hypothetical protein